MIFVVIILSILLIISPFITYFIVRKTIRNAFLEKWKKEVEYNQRRYGLYKTSFNHTTTNTNFNVMAEIEETGYTSNGMSKINIKSLTWDVYITNDEESMRKALVNKIGDWVKTSDIDFYKDGNIRRIKIENLINNI